MSPEKDAPQASHKIEGETYSGSDRILQAGIDKLRESNHDSVSIYAPTGAWVHEEEATRDIKKEWFWTIACCLANAQGAQGSHLRENLSINKPRGMPKGTSIPTTNLTSFSGVYGLPPIRPTFDGAKRLWRDLEYLRELLAYFDNIRSAQLHFLKVDTNTIPGTGAIIIDSTVLFIGFAISDPHRVNYGFMLSDQTPSLDHKATDAVVQVEHWFTRHILGITRDNVIQELDKSNAIPSKTLARGGTIWRYAYSLLVQQIASKILILLFILQTWSLYFLMRQPLEKSSDPNGEIAISVILALYLALVAISGIRGVFYTLLVVLFFFASFFVPDDVTKPIYLVSALFSILAGIDLVWRWVNK